ncbi:alpha/beta hydrolase family esterase [Actinomycetospora cinnamomea]|uniref:Poly(Hydroxyalkanoate) depolymerase family esterase n=1 Tax=Actinomycetospora cinnamomea TaxID=663609 RepID=A0A2U1EU30_9PSEU|nr:PHB depolymerase family esterase [Actinomycetospora cinnamomea]PVZ03419.1 poly(hydroxyalkanoate) depolymerase family esterase [Actinomycetospora cinnamomea]
MFRTGRMLRETLRAGAAGPSEATRLVREGRLMEATAKIQERLGGLPGGPAGGVTGAPDMPGVPGMPGSHGAAGGSDRAPGTVTRGSAGGLAYRLYVPTTVRDGAPLLLMLHGGTQDADGFAASTGTDEAAERAGVIVAYPEQSRSANPMGYWNWFRPGDQRRDAGEPAMIAAVAREVTARHEADPGRVAVAGFSAGGAMAAVMAATYPDLFCGAGVHSGLAYGAARDVGSAFAAMSNPPATVTGAGPVPLVVVHGDADRTVAVGNGEAVVRSALTGAGGVAHERAPGRVEGGRAWTRERWAEPGGRVLAESWTVHGLGHAWSGGRAGASYADPSGPDAGAAMLAFFGFTDDGRVR